jgi:hypothetical protein
MWGGGGEGQLGYEDGKKQRNMGTVAGGFANAKVDLTLRMDGLCDGFNGEDSKLEVAVVLVWHQRRYVDN